MATEVQVKDLTAITSANLQNGDVLLVRDVSVTSGNQAKGITIAELDGRWISARAYSTKSAMETAAPPNGSISYVFGDSSSNNGWYYRTGSGVYEQQAVSASGATTFIALTDTPAAYVAGKFVKVNAAGNGIEFVDEPGVDGEPGALTRQVLANAVSLAEPTNNAPQSTGWTDIFSHTVTSTEANQGYMFINVDINASITAATDLSGNRPAMAIRLIKGTTVLAEDERYFRFTAGTALTARCGNITSVAENDVIKVQAQMFRLTAAGMTVNASVNTDSQWSRFSFSGGATAAAIAAAAGSFIGLSDTPSAYVANKFVKTNAAGNAVEFVDAPAGGLSQAQVDARIEEFTDQANADDRIPRSKTSANLEVYDKGLIDGGVRPWPNSNIQIGGMVSNTAYTASDYGNITNWSNTIPTADGTAKTPAWFALRLAKSVYTTAPAAIPDNILIVFGDEAPVMLSRFSRLNAADTASHWAYNAAIANLPGGETGISLEIDEPATSKVLPPDGSIKPVKLDGVAEGDGNKIVTVAGDGQTFVPLALAGRRQLFSGTQGINVTNATHQSVNAFAFTNALDLDNVGSGLMDVIVTYTIVTRSSNSVSFDADDNSDTVAEADGHTSYAQIRRHNAYNGTTAVGEPLAPQHIYLGATLLGTLSINPNRSAANATSGVAIYTPSESHSQTSVNFAVQAAIEVYANDYGVEAVNHGNAGSTYIYEALPDDASDFEDDDIILVKGGGGVYAKQTVIEPVTSDTGLQDNTIDPHDLAVAHVGVYTVMYYSAAGFTFTRGSATAALAAGGSAAIGTALPGGGRIVYSFLTNGNSSGLIQAIYTSSRTETNSVTLTIGNSAFILTRQSATRWQSATLTATDRGDLLRGVWRSSIPGAPGHKTTESLERISPEASSGGGGGGWTELFSIGLGASSSFILSEARRTMLLAAGYYMWEVTHQSRVITGTFQKVDTTSSVYDFRMSAQPISSASNAVISLYISSGISYISQTNITPRISTTHAGNMTIYKWG